MIRQPRLNLGPPLFVKVEERTQELMKGLYNAVVAMDGETTVEYSKAVLI